MHAFILLTDADKDEYYVVLITTACYPTFRSSNFGTEIA
jgi:hypothetical protein